MVDTSSFFVPQRALGKTLMCFTTSNLHGNSKGIYQSFNIADHVGDDIDNVASNRQILEQIIYEKACELGNKKAQSLKRIKWLNQQHTSTVFEYKDYYGQACDAIVTDFNNTPLCVMTADCLPVVMFSPSQNKLAAVHAGWRGLLNGVIEKTLSYFSTIDDIQTWIGPSISATKFEVQSDVIDLFKQYNSFTKLNGQNSYQVDLVAVAKKIMQVAGIKDIQTSKVCTYQNQTCYSHRRSTHQGCQNTGRMATVVMQVA